MGGTDYARDAPRYSVINVEDFKSAKHLAIYLKELNKNDDAYNEYFNWKNNYKIISVKDSFKAGFCKLCDVLNDDSLGNKAYIDIDSWWGKTKYCDINKYKTLIKL